MNLLENFKKPIWLFSIGMLFVLFAVFLKIINLLLLFQMPMFIVGFLIEIIALFTFLRKK